MQNTGPEMVSAECTDYALSCTIFHSLALSYTILHHLALSCTILHSLALSWTILHYLALSWTIFHYLALSCTLLHYLALSCTDLHYLALSCTSLHIRHTCNQQMSEVIAFDIAVVAQKVKVLCCYWGPMWSEKVGWWVSSRSGWLLELLMELKMAMPYSAHRAVVGSVSSY